MSITPQELLREWETARSFKYGDILKPRDGVKPKCTSIGTPGLPAPILHFNPTEDSRVVVIHQSVSEPDPTIYVVIGEHISSSDYTRKNVEFHINGYEWEYAGSAKENDRESPMDLLRKTMCYRKGEL